MKFLICGFIGIASRWKPDRNVRCRASAALAGHPGAGPKGQQTAFCSWGNMPAAVFGKARLEQQRHQ